METLEAFYQSTLAALREANNEVRFFGSRQPMSSVSIVNLMRWLDCRACAYTEIIRKGQSEAGEGILGEAGMDETQIGQ